MRRRAFTLIEMLIATAIFSTVLIAMNTVFYGALRLQRTTSRVVEEAIPVNHALNVMKRDLLSTLAPGGVLAGPVMGGRLGSALDTSLSSQMGSGSGSGQNGLSSLQIYTTSGLTDDSSAASLVDLPQPWPEIQKVAYYLRDPIYSTTFVGKDLVRAISRNLLAVTEEIAVEEPLLRGVENIEFLFYDGTLWRESWDSSTDTNSVLQAVRVQIELAPENRDERLRKPPIELVVPVVIQARTNQVSSTATSSPGQNNSNSGPPQTPGPQSSTPQGGGTPAGGGGRPGGPR